jgi:hypothetical protein
LIDAVKAIYKTKPITFIVEEEELSIEERNILVNRLEEDESTYITSQQSVDMLKKKFEF